MEQATDRVGMIVRAAPAVIDRVLAAAVRVAFQQAQLAQQAGMIGQVDKTARERRQSFEVERDFGSSLRIYVMPQVCHAPATHPKA